MKSEKNILIAFVLNLFFAVFEFVGGAFTKSVAIMSDAVHDLGDAVSIGIAWALERKSRKQPDEVYTYGYARYSVIGSVITTLVLTVGSALVIYHSVLRILHPVPVNYDGMILIGIIAVIINSAAAFFTREGKSLNQKAVNLHMLEDVLGWLVILIGAIVMHFTEITRIDPLLSITVSVFILIHALKNLKECLDIFLEKAPQNISLSEIREHLLAIDGVSDIHHLHLWSMDGQNHIATLHAVSDNDPAEMKQKLRAELAEHRILHATIEIERSDEACAAKHCRIDAHPPTGHHHH